MLTFVSDIAGEISSTVAHIMVPNPTKSIIAETQARLTDIIRELEKNLSRLIILVGDQRMNTSIDRWVKSQVGRNQCSAVYHLSWVFRSFSLCLSFPSLDLDLVAAEQDSSDKASSTPTGDELQEEDGSSTPVQKDLELAMEELNAEEVDAGTRRGGRESSMSEDMVNIPSPIPEVDELVHDHSEDKVCSDFALVAITVLES